MRSSSSHTPHEQRSTFNIGQLVVADFPNLWVTTPNSKTTLNYHRFHVTHEGNWWPCVVVNRATTSRSDNTDGACDHEMVPRKLTCSGRTVTIELAFRRAGRYSVSLSNPTTRQMWTLPWFKVHAYGSKAEEATANTEQTRAAPLLLAPARSSCQWTPLSFKFLPYLRRYLHPYRRTLLYNEQQTVDYQTKPEWRYLLLHQFLLAECTSAPQDWFDNHKSQVYETHERLRQALMDVMGATGERAVMFRVYFCFITQYIYNKATQPEQDKLKKLTAELFAMLAGESRLPCTLQATILLHQGVSKCLNVAQRTDCLERALRRLSQPGGNLTIILLRLLAVLMERREGEGSAWVDSSDIYTSLPPGRYCTTHARELSRAAEICDHLNQLPMARRDSIQYNLALSDLGVRSGNYAFAHQRAKQAAYQAAMLPEISFDLRCAVARIKNIKKIVSLDDRPLQALDGWALSGAIS